MPLTLVTGPANAGKARVVMDALRAHCARGEEPLLVVPTRADVEHYRRELAAEGLVPGGERGAGGALRGPARRGHPPRGPSERPLGRLARERVLAACASAGGGVGRAPGGGAARDRGTRPDAADEPRDPRRGARPGGARGRSSRSRA